MLSIVWSLTSTVTGRAGSKAYIMIQLSLAVAWLTCRSSVGNRTLFSKRGSRRPRVPALKNKKKTKKEQTLTDKLVSPNCAIDGVDGVVWNPGEGAEVA